MFHINRTTTSPLYFVRSVVLTRSGGVSFVELVPVTAVFVTLGFPPMEAPEGGDPMHAQHMEEVARNQVSEILLTLSAKTVEPEMEIRSRDDGTTLKFTLVGENKVDVASHLEDMVSPYSSP